MAQKQGKPRRKGAGRVPFLARKDMFRQLLEAGHPQRAIYDDYGPELEISYSQFNRYIARYLPPGDRQNIEPDQGLPPAPEPAAADQPTPELDATTHVPGLHPVPTADTTASPEPQPFKPKRFIFDPNGGNTRDDLV